MLDPLYYVSSLSKISGDKCRDHWSGTKLLGASRSASKSENSDRCNYSFPQLHWKQEYPRCCQIVFHRSETFPFNFVFLLESFSSKPHKTQPVFVALNLVGITSMACLPSIQLTFSQINKLIWQQRVSWGVEFSHELHSDYLRAHKLKILNCVTDMASCSRVQPFSSGRDADQTQESGENRA